MNGPARDTGPKADTGGSDKAGDPGVGEAIGGVRAAVMRMISAHLTLLRAELAIAGKEIGIIVGLAAGAVAIAILAVILLYVGSFLFLGELLFGSMGWGIIHGTLLAAAFIGFVAIDLAGGEMRRYGYGAAIGLAVAVLTAALLLSNIGNTLGEGLRSWVVDNIQSEQLPFGDEWFVLLIGLGLGALIGLALGLVIAWRARLSGGARRAVIIGLPVVGLITLGIYLPTSYEAPDGVLGLAIAAGLLAWVIAGAILAARGGFDPEARYANLIPRETIAAATRSKEFLTDEFARQKDRMMGR